MALKKRNERNNRLPKHFAKKIEIISFKFELEWLSGWALIRKVCECDEGILNKLGGILEKKAH